MHDGNHRDCEIDMKPYKISALTYLDPFHLLQNGKLSHHLVKSGENMPGGNCLLMFLNEDAKFQTVLN